MPGYFRYLSAKLPLPDNGFERVRSLRPGQALVFCSNPDFEVELEDSGKCFEMQVRPRLTEDSGRTKRNASASGPESGSAAEDDDIDWF